MMSPWPCCVCLVGQPLWAVLAPWLRVLQRCAPPADVVLVVSSIPCGCAGTPSCRSETLFARWKPRQERFVLLEGPRTFIPSSSHLVHSTWRAVYAENTCTWLSRHRPSAARENLPMCSAYRGFTGEIAGSIRSILNNSSRFQQNFSWKIPPTQSRALGHAGVTLTTPSHGHLSPYFCEKRGFTRFFTGKVPRFVKRTTFNPPNGF